MKVFLCLLFSWCFSQYFSQSSLMEPWLLVENLSTFFTCLWSSPLWILWLSLDDFLVKAFPSTLRGFLPRFWLRAGFLLKAFTPCPHPFIPVSLMWMLCCTQDSSFFFRASCIQSTWRWWSMVCTVLSAGGHPLLLMVLYSVHLWGFSPFWIL